MIVVVLAGAGCTISTNYEGTNYRCNETTTCPSGYTCDRGMCVHGVADASLPQADGDTIDAPGSTIDAGPQPLYPPWWDTGYAHRRRLTVHPNGSDLVPATYQLWVQQDVEALIGNATPYNELRMTYWNATAGTWTEITRVVDTSQGSDEFVWFAAQKDISPVGIDEGYYLYYSNASAPGSMADPADVFEYYDPFDAFDPALQINGGPTVSGGVLHLNTNDSVRTFATWDSNYAVDFTMHVATWGNRIWGGWQRSGDFIDDEPWAVWITRTPNTGMIWPELISTEAGVGSVWTGGLEAIDPAAFIEYSVERYSRLVVYRFDHLETGTFMLPQPWTTATQLRLTNESPNLVTFGMVRVRQAEHPAPNVTVGAEENVPP